MGSRYYYAIDGQQFGPVSSRDLRRLAAAGQLQPTDLVWKEGAPKWILASRVKGLYAATPKKPQINTDEHRSKRRRD